MSWFSTKTATPARSTIRQQEVGILQRTMRDLNWITPDETCLKMIPVGPIQLTLSIHIPADYPQKPPVLRVLTPAQHQWLDSQGFLTLCPAVTNWNPNSPSLVSLIQFIEAKFRESPPIPTQPAPQNTYQPPQQQQQNGYGMQYNPNQSANNYNNQYNQQQQQPQQSGNYGAPPNLNHSMSYVPPVAPQQPNRPSYSASSGGYNPGQSQTSYSGTGNFPQQQPLSPSNNSSFQSPSTPIQTTPVEKPGPKYASQSIPRPSTPQPPPEAPVQLAPIPPEPTVDRAMVQRFPISKLEKLDSDVSELKTQVGQNVVINQMYESLLKTQFEVDELQKNLDRINPKLAPLQAEIAGKKASIAAKEAEFANLKRDYDVKVKEFDVGTFIADLQRQLVELDDDGEEMMTKFVAIRTPTEDELGDFLNNYEKIRQQYHIKSLILKKLKMNLAR